VGTAVTGVGSGLLVAENSAGHPSTSSYYFNALRVSSVNGLNEMVVQTHTQLDVSLAYGGTQTGDLKIVNLTFERFKRVGRVGDPFPDNGTEDVTLQVQHLCPTGAPVLVGRPYTLRDARKDQSHIWNEGNTALPLPTFRALMRDGDTVLISMTGSDGTVQKGLNFAAVSAAGFPGSPLDIDQPSTQRSYQLWLSGSAVAP
jgi:hypothetical protein